jgi:HEAT repeat protein
MFRRLPAFLFRLVATTFAALTIASAAAAEVRLSIPAGGGLGALDVRVDLAGAVVIANSTAVPIVLERNLIPDEADVLVEAVALPGARKLVHVRVPVRGSDLLGPAWEALLVSGRGQPIFSGMTGLSRGDPGERTGIRVRIVPAGVVSQVLLGTLREDLRICGETETLLDPRAVDPTSLDLRPVEAERLTGAEQARAQRLAAVDKGTVFDAPLGKLLVARGSSTADSLGLELTDGNVGTVWRERQPGIGQGEFVVMAAPKEVPIARLQIAVSPPSGVKIGAVPKTFYLVTADRSFLVTLPESAARKPGEIFEVVFPEPIETSCLALVLDRSNASVAHPDVGVAEAVAFSDLDVPGATLDGLAEQLSGPRSGEAAQLLERGGSGAIAAVMKAYAKLDAHGRALTVDVAAASDRCEDAGPLLARGLCEKEGEAARKALEKLERCPPAASALARALRMDPTSRTCVAPVFATLFPTAALEPIADALGEVPETDPATRSILRSAFGRALRQAGGGRLGALLSDPNRRLRARLELLRGAAEYVVDAAPSCDAAIDELMKSGPSMQVRYLVLGPLAVLAGAGDSAAATRLVDALLHDKDWPVRARAAELSGGLPLARDALVAAVHDPEPRVRESVLAAMAPSPPPSAVGAAIDVMAGDDWSLVKKQAAGLLAHAPASNEVDDALGRSLSDRLVSVRGAALVALARRRAVRWHRAIRERLDDEAEDVHLRAAAAGALGAVCDISSTDRLTGLARELAIPQRSDEPSLGLAALTGLAALHPADLEARLAPLLARGAPTYVRAAAERALAARGVCP